MERLSDYLADRFAHGKSDYNIVSAVGTTNAGMSTLAIQLKESVEFDADRDLDELMGEVEKEDG